MDSFSSAFYAAHPTLAWMCELFMTSALLLTALYFGKGCWQAARQNQRLALADAADHRYSSERRSLLVPTRATHIV